MAFGEAFFLEVGQYALVTLSFWDCHFLRLHDPERVEAIGTDGWLFAMIGGGYSIAKRD